MQNKKTKIFLGAYLNYTNAQNLNCLALAKNLNKEKFEVYALTCHFGDKIEIDVNLFNCFKPFIISRIFGLIWGIFKCDVAYLPNHYIPNWVLRLAKVLGKKTFTTIEANMCDRSKRNILDYLGGEQSFKKHFNLIPNIFGITKDIISKANCGVQLEKKPLYLGVDCTNFTPKVKQKLNNIVYVGRLVKSKDVIEILSLADIFSNINFHLVGQGNLRTELLKKATTNVKFYGLLNHNELNDLFLEMDLHFLPSKSEGFPKVILETAAAGIPSIVYADYGAKEWISHSNNGFVINEFEQIVEIVKELQKNKNLLKENSKAAILLSEKFDWRIMIKDWENQILNLK